MSDVLLGEQLVRRLWSRIGRLQHCLRLDFGEQGAVSATARPFLFCRSRQGPRLIQPAL